MGQGGFLPRISQINTDSVSLGFFTGGNREHKAVSLLFFATKRHKDLLANDLFEAPSGARLMCVGRMDLFAPFCGNLMTIYELVSQIRFMECGSQ